MRTGRWPGSLAQGGKDAGFAYVLLLIAVALIGVSAAAAVSLGATMARRDAEQQLLAIGAEFQQALRSYAGAPANAPAAIGLHGPRTLEELLKDPRAPNVRRHLRQLYADPLTGKPEWGLVVDGQGFITGVYSLAEGSPIKRSAFDPPQWLGLEDAQSYRDWLFGLPQPGAAAPPEVPSSQGLSSTPVR